MKRSAHHCLGGGGGDLSHEEEGRAELHAANRRLVSLGTLSRLVFTSGDDRGLISELTR